MSTALGTSTSLIYNVWPLNCALCSSSSIRPPQSDSTPSLLLSQNLIPSFSIPTFTSMQRLCTPHPQKAIRFATPGSRFIPSIPTSQCTITQHRSPLHVCWCAPLVYSPRLLSTTVVSCPLPVVKISSLRLVPNSSITAHIQNHLLTF